MIKTKILKFLIKKNGSYDRELLVELMRTHGLKIFIIRKFYRKFLKMNFENIFKLKKYKAKPQTCALEQIGNAFGVINQNAKFSTRIKNLIN